jgi:hypothetical protein
MKSVNPAGVRRDAPPSQPAEDAGLDQHTMTPGELSRSTCVADPQTTAARLVRRLYAGPEESESCDVA